MQKQHDLKLEVKQMAAGNNDQRLFLLTVLQSISDNGCDEKVVYPLFKQNLGLLNEEIIGTFKNWVADKFAEVTEDEQYLVALNIGNLANLISNFSLGNKAVNVELSIACYEILLGFFTVYRSPEIWAMTQNNFADAYSKRIDGKGSENLRHAIDYYQLALEVFTSQDFPNEWISIQLKLAKLSIEKMLDYQLAMEHLQAAYDYLSVNIAVPDY